MELRSTGYGSGESDGSNPSNLGRCSPAGAPWTTSRRGAVGRGSYDPAAAGAGNV